MATAGIGDAPRQFANDLAQPVGMGKQDAGDEETIGDGVALAGVSKYPARVKCALLSWAAYTDALARAGADISTISTGGNQ